MNPSIGFIGFGEASFNIAKGLTGEGIETIYAYDKFWDVEPNSILINKRAVEAGVNLVKSIEELVQKSDIIISAVSANLAVPLAEETVPFLKENQIYVDINAASPMTKEKVYNIISKSKALFVDVAVMGPVPTYGHKVPMIVCGNGAKQFMDIMKKYNMNIIYQGEKAGSASAMKMFRSIFMKGFVTLLLETIIAGHKYGVEDSVLASIEETLQEGNSLHEVINGLLTRSVIHSKRREHEMEEVISTLENMGVNYIMSKATKEKLSWCSNLNLKEYFNGVPPKDFHEILKAIDQI